MLKIFRIIILLSAILAAGCTSPRPQTQLVEVPVPVDLPAAKLPPEPHYPIQDLHEKSSDEETMKSYIVTVYLLKAQNAICRDQLRQYGHVQNTPN